MNKYRNAHRRPSNAKPKRHSIQHTAQHAERSYMCSLLHDLPDDSLLSTLPPHKVLNYIPHWTTSRSQNFKRTDKLKKGQVCLVSFLVNGNVSFLPLDALSAQDVNYAIGYDFHASHASQYAHVYSLGGFSIVSIPQHDFVAALRFYGQKDYANALLFSDRAITNLASINPKALSRESERHYERFLKLLNLYLSVSETPEGILAVERALQQAAKCFNILTGASHQNGAKSCHNN